MTGQENFVTIDFQTVEEFRGTAFVWKTLKRIMSQTMFETIRDMRLYTNRKGAVFDIPEEHSETILELYENDKNSKKYIDYEIKLAEELPDLFDLDSAQPSGDFKTRNYRGGDMSARDNTDDSSAPGTFFRNNNKPSHYDGFSHGGGFDDHKGSRNNQYSGSSSYRANNMGSYSGYKSHGGNSYNNHGYAQGSGRGARGKRHQGRYRDQY